MLFFLIPFTIAWDAFLLFWYSMAAGGNAPWIVIVVPIAHVAAGIGLTYFVFASLLNTTRITVGPRALEVRHGPLPWRGNAVYERSQIEQLFCKRKERRGKNGAHVSYELRLALRDARAVKLVSNGLEESRCSTWSSASSPPSGSRIGPWRAKCPVEPPKTPLERYFSGAFTRDRRSFPWSLPEGPRTAS